MGTKISQAIWHSQKMKRMSKLEKKNFLKCYCLCFRYVLFTLGWGAGGKNNLNVSGPVIHQFSLPSDRYSSWMGLVPATPPPRLGPYSVIYFWLDGVLFLSACQCRRCGFDPWVGKNPWRRKMTIHSSILTWEIPWTEEPGGLQSMELQELDTT